MTREQKRNAQKLQRKRMKARMKSYFDTRELVTDLDGNTVVLASQKPDAMAKLRKEVRDLKARGATPEQIAMLPQDDEEATYGEALKRALNSSKDDERRDGSKMHDRYVLARKIKKAEADAAGDGIVSLDTEEVTLAKDAITEFWLTPAMHGALWEALEGEQPKSRAKLAAEAVEKTQ